MTTERQTAADQTGAVARPTVRTADLHRLVAALSDLRKTLVSMRFPLDLPTAPAAANTCDAMAAELSDYLIPRAPRLDAPPMIVVGGSTGVGKSTLVNSLVRAPISASGVLRPTTRVPVLVHHPEDERWFSSEDLLPWLARGPGSAYASEHGAVSSHAQETLQISSTLAMPRGIALLDAPDVDSVVEANRQLARRLLAAADLWLFVTTATRYADAVPWDLLRAARTRSTATALVLNRVPVGAEAELADSLAKLLSANDLVDVPLFVVSESDRDEFGMLAADRVAPILTWLTAIAGSQEIRAAVVRQTVGGAIDTIEPSVETLAIAADDQAAASSALATLVNDIYGTAEWTAATAIRDGTLIRGEVHARWHKLLHAPDLLWIVPTRLGRAPDRVAWLRSRSTWLRHQAGWTRDRVAWSRDVAATMVGRGGRVPRLWQALETGLVALLSNTALCADQQVRQAWHATPAGAALLADAPPDEAGVARLARDLIGQWRDAVRDLVEAAAAHQRASRRIGAHAVGTCTTLTTVLACAQPAFASGGALEAIFGQPAATTLVEAARVELVRRIGAFCSSEAARHHQILASQRIEATAGDQLRALARETTIARLCAGLPAARMAPAALPASSPVPAMPQRVPHQDHASSIEGFPWPASSTS